MTKLTKSLKIINYHQMSREHIAHETNIEVSDVINIEHGKADDDLITKYINMCDELYNIDIPQTLIDDRRKYVTAKLIAERLNVSPVMIHFLETGKRVSIKLEQQYQVLVSDLIKYKGDSLTLPISDELQNIISELHILNIHDSELKQYTNLSTTRLQHIAKGFGCEKDVDEYIRTAKLAITKRKVYMDANAKLDPRKDDKEFQAMLEDDRD